MESVNSIIPCELYFLTCFKLIRKELWGITGRLQDHFNPEGRFGLIMYNSEAICKVQKQLHLNDPFIDKKIHEVFRVNGYNKEVINDYVGIHHPEWTPEEAFKA